MPTVLITGACKGLGASLVERFASRGWCVVATGIGGSNRLEALRQRFPEQVLQCDLDVASATSIAAARASILERVVGIDVLVNNAAILPAEGRGELGHLNYDAGLRIYDVNALGPLRVTEAFLPLLERGQRKLIVNVSSEAGSVADCWRKDDYFYCMSKSALNMQSAILRNALEPRGIGLLVVHPGWMRTEMGGANADIDPSEAAEGIFALIERAPGAEGIYFDYRGSPLRW